MTITCYDFKVEIPTDSVIRIQNDTSCGERFSMYVIVKLTAKDLINFLHNNEKRPYYIDINDTEIELYLEKVLLIEF